jgi:hypothetical protein
MNKAGQKQVRRRIKPIAMWLLAISLLAVTILVMHCFFDNKIQAPANAIPTQYLALDATASSNFSNDVGFIDDMNHGLTLERINSVAVAGFPTPSPNYIPLLVLNHATEPIRFANVGFDIQVFEFHESTKEWQRITLPYTPEQKVTIIPAKLETYDFSVLNGWDLSPDDFAGATSKAIRIFVVGDGVLTKKKYGAFLDITLQFSSIHGSSYMAF